MAGAVTAGSGSGAVVATDCRFEGAAVESRALPEPHAVVATTTSNSAGHHADTAPQRTRVSR